MWAAVEQERERALSVDCGAKNTESILPVTSEAEETESVLSVNSGEEEKERVRSVNSGEGEKERVRSVDCGAKERERVWGAPSREAMEEALMMRQGRRATALLAQSAVAICGLGGLGSHIAFALARAGVGRLILIDFDCVEVSNLHRQQYKVTQVGEKKTEALRQNLGEIAPYLQVETHYCRVTAENLTTLLAEADVICEAFDVAEEKAMLVNGVLEHFPGKPLVAASGMAGFGEANAIKTRRMTRNFYLCGDGTSEVGEDHGLVSTRVMLCAAHQAHVVVRILLREDGDQ